MGQGIDIQILDGAGLSIAIVAARWNAPVVEPMLAAARDELRTLGVTKIVVYRVPGAFELPFAANRLQRHCSAVIVLGAVIRGETPHFDFVAGECARGIMDLNLKDELATPVIFGVLTTNDLEQANQRADPLQHNKGAEVARAAVEMALCARSLGSFPHVHWEKP